MSEINLKMTADSSQTRTHLYKHRGYLQAAKKKSYILFYKSFCAFASVLSFKLRLFFLYDFLPKKCETKAKEKKNKTTDVLCKIYQNAHRHTRKDTNEVHLMRFQGGKKPITYILTQWYKMKHSHLYTFRFH